jgi:anaerobic selenocysteine-containing dehydrogenase
MSESRRLKTMCPMNCHPTFCGMEVEVQDDRVLGIRGDADNPDSHGFLCIRGQASREIVDNPLRVLRPRMRAARRDDAWRDASWDAALDRIAGAIRTAGPESVAVWMGHGIIVNTAADGWSRASPTCAASRPGSRPSYAGASAASACRSPGQCTSTPRRTWGRTTDLIILWGANLASQPNTAPHLVAAKRRGAHVVAIDVREPKRSSRLTRAT